MKFFHEADALLDRGKLGNFLTTDTAFNAAVLDDYTAHMPNLQAGSLLDVLRTAIGRVRLPGDAGRLTRYLDSLARAYTAKNGTVKSQAHCFTFFYALLTLNTAMHVAPADAAREMTFARFKAMVADALAAEPDLTESDVTIMFTSVCAVFTERSMGAPRCGSQL